MLGASGAGGMLPCRQRAPKHDAACPSAHPPSPFHCHIATALQDHNHAGSLANRELGMPQPLRARQSSPPAAARWRQDAEVPGGVDAFLQPRSSTAGLLSLGSGCGDVQLLGCAPSGRGRAAAAAQRRAATPIPMAVRQDAQVGGNRPLAVSAACAATGSAACAGSCPTSHFLPLATHVQSGAGAAGAVPGRWDGLQL